MERSNREPPLKILLVAAEVAPFTIVGGLAFVAAALPRALHGLGHDVRVVMPKYTRVDESGMPMGRRVAGLPVPMGAETVAVDVLESRLAPDAPVPVYLIDHPASFDRPEIYEYPDDAERFMLFSRAVLEMLPALDWWPDVIHCNDWHTGLIPNWLRTVYRDSPNPPAPFPGGEGGAYLPAPARRGGGGEVSSFRPKYGQLTSVFTIHNLFHQGTAPLDRLALAGLDAGGPEPIEVQAFPGEMNFMARGLRYADRITTVSPQYACEIQTPEYGEGLDPLLRARHDHLVGILNGIDTEERNPATSRYLPARFDADHMKARPANKKAFQKELGLPARPAVPLLAASSRLMPQKGFDILIPAVEALLGGHEVQFVMAGSGKAAYVALFQALQARYPEQVAYISNPDPGLIERLYAGSDIYLMPSRFEPCGLGQMFAMRYGSVPVVHATGGLIDTVQDYDPATGCGNGFVFAPYSAEACRAATERALALYADRPAWERLVQHDLTLDWSWDGSARRYVELYTQARQGLAAV